MGNHIFYIPDDKFLVSFKNKGHDFQFVPSVWIIKNGGRTKTSHYGWFFIYLYKRLRTCPVRGEYEAMEKPKCLNCNKEMEQFYDPIAKELSKYTWHCECMPTVVISIG